MDVDLWEQLCPTLFSFSSQNTVQFSYIPAVGTDWRVHTGVPGEFASQGKYENVCVQAFPKGKWTAVLWKVFVLTRALIVLWSKPANLGAAFYTADIDIWKRLKHDGFSQRTLGIANLVKVMRLVTLGSNLCLGSPEPIFKMKTCSWKLCKYSHTGKVCIVCSRGRAEQEAWERNKLSYSCISLPPHNESTQIPLSLVQVWGIKGGGEVAETEGTDSKTMVMGQAVKQSPSPICKVRTACFSWSTDPLPSPAWSYNRMQTN